MLSKCRKWHCALLTETETRFQTAVVNKMQEDTSVKPARPTKEMHHVNFDMQKNHKNRGKFQNADRFFCLKTLNLLEYTQF